MNDKAETVRRLLWSIGGLVGFVLLRFASNVVLAYLLAPTVLGAMVIISTLRLGFELMTDVGIEQNIVTSKHGLDPTFLNTAWTLQILRGVILTFVFLLASPAIAEFYSIQTSAIVAISFAPLLTSLHSISIFILVRKLEVRRRSLFELRAEAVGVFTSIGLAMVVPNVWALICGTLVSIVGRSASSYLLPHPRHRLTLDASHTGEIFRFGRWITLSSLAMFAANNLDKIILSKVASLSVLGIYGLARTLADVLPLLARRLSYEVLFPTLRASASENRSLLSPEFGSLRSRLVLAVAVVCGSAVATADLAVAILYDPRYSAAGWMLSTLLIASWFSILSSLNEAVLLAAGRPAFEGGANVIRCALLGALLWFGYERVGLVAAPLAVLGSELGRYSYVAYGQHKFDLSFRKQDIYGTLAFVGTVAIAVLVRSACGFGIPWVGSTMIFGHS